MTACRRLFSVAAACWLLAIAVPVVAHPVPVAEARLEIQQQGYVVVLRCDVAAYLMQARPGHLGEMLAEELQSMPEEDLAQRLKETGEALRTGAKIEVDGRVLTPERIELPTPASVRQTTAHGEDAAMQAVWLRGSVPQGAKRVRATFPSGIGRVNLILIDPQGHNQQQSVPPDQWSDWWELTPAGAEARADVASGQQPRLLLRYLAAGAVVMVLLFLLTLRWIYRRPS